jgi:nucleoside-diphosphate-sugar epimerase
MPDDMRVLLTGATGFIGSYVLKSLLNQNIDVVALGRKKPRALQRSQFIEADLLTTQNYDQLFAEHNFTHFLHLAWYTEHGKYWTSPLNLRWVETTVKLVEAFCKAGGKHVTVAGTCAEYDWSFGYCREDATPLKPFKLYGVAKDATRRLVSELCSCYQIPCSWGRVFLPYGKGESSLRLIPSLIDVFQGRRKPFGVNADVYRDFLHAADVASAFRHLLSKKTEGIYNICSAQPVQLSKVVTFIADCFKVDPMKILRLNVPVLKEPPMLVGSNNKLKAIGWEQKVGIESFLKEHIENRR